MSANKKEKIWFAQLLRGVACLIVVYFHYFDLFWSKHDRVTELANLNNTDFNSNLFILQISSLLENLNINLGAVGVSLFFIISGFVIPFSLANSGKISFLIKRFFRVLPPYAVGLSLTTLVVFIYSRMNNLEFPHTALDFIVNLSLLRDWAGFPTIDGINWTLEMELKFYFLMAILSIFFSIKSSKALLISSSLLFATTLLFSFTLDSVNVYVAHLLSVVSRSAIYLTYMMIGVCFYNYFKSNWQTAKFLSVVAFLMFFTIANMYLRIPDSFSSYSVSYVLGFVLFGSFYLIRDKILYNSTLNFFANISYPMYVLHAVIGYTLISVFYSFIPNPYLVVAIVFSIITLLSHLLHKYIELPSNKLGYKTAALISGLRTKKSLKYRKKQPA